jgi:hypothetical protein
MRGATTWKKEVSRKQTYLGNSSCCGSWWTAAIRAAPYASDIDRHIATIVHEGRHYELDNVLAATLDRMRDDVDYTDVCVWMLEEESCEWMCVFKQDTTSFSFLTHIAFFMTFHE